MVFEQYSGMGKAHFKINLTGFTGADERMRMSNQLVEIIIGRDLNKK